MPSARSFEARRTQAASGTRQPPRNLPSNLPLRSGTSGNGSSADPLALCDP